MPTIKNGKTYDRLKFLAQIGFPAFGSLYFALAGIWGLPGAEKVLGTVLAVDTFLGVLLNLSSAAYNASDDRFSGQITVDPVKELVNVGLASEELKGKDEVTLKVVAK